MIHGGKRCLAILLALCLSFTLISEGVLTVFARDASVESETEAEANWDDPTYVKLMMRQEEDSGIRMISSLDGFVTNPESGKTYIHTENKSDYDLLHGIDVSYYNGDIDWSQVKASGIDFVIIRIGYRGYGQSGNLAKDSRYESYISGAKAAGLDVGVYFFTQAITTAEAKEEAEWVLNTLNGTSLDCPVAIDYEDLAGGRQSNAKLSASQATDICLAFCQTIDAGGYESMVYANYSYLMNNLNASELEAETKIWIARYNYATLYDGDYSFWQCTDQGSVAGISGNVDLDFYYRSDSDVSDMPLSKPQLTGISNTVSGVKITWNTVEGAEKYQVLRKNSDGSWTKLDDTSSTSYTDKTVESGTTYTYTVCCVDSDGIEYTSDYNSSGLTITFLSAPVLSSVAGSGSGVKITWNSVKGAAKYRVFRKVSGDSSWHKLGDVSSATTDYTDKSAKAGTTYTYTVRCIDSSGNSYTSSYDSTGLTLKYAATPSLDSITASSSGVKITWNKASGAEKYRLFRKASGDSGWTKLEDVSSSTLNYTDKTASSGSSYTYTVRCVTSDGKSYAGGYDSTGLTLKYAATPTLEKLSSNGSGVQITWSKANGAAKYRVFRKTGSGSWKKLADVSSSTLSYTDKTVKTGTSYTYTVRCITSDGKTYTGGYDSTGLSVTYAAAPKLVSVSGTGSGVKITWSKSTGAVNYKVFRKTGSGSWKSLGTTTGTSFTDKTAKAGTSYTYTVRPVTKDGKYYAGSYDSKGLTIKYAATPILGKLTAGSSGVKITWSKATGAVNYKVFRKTDGGSWKGLGTTTGTSFTDKTAQAGTSYTYTVRPITANGKYYAGGYDSKGLTLQYAATPTLTGITGSDSGVKLTWNKSTGAVNYKVFRKTGSGSWKSLGTTTGTSFTDKTAKAGTSYTYTVRPITANGKYYAGGYDRIGQSIVYSEINE